MTSLLLLASMLAQPSPQPSDLEAPARFAKSAPFPGLPSVLLDKRQTGAGIANQWSRNRRLQGRMLWIDATANLSRVNSDAKIAELVDTIADVGFNTVVFDVKPIVGRTMYPSDLVDQLTLWRDRTMPEGYDPLAAFVRETKRRGLSLLIAMNAFSEGHQFAKREAGPTSNLGDPGWGYTRPDLQTVQYDATPVLEVSGHELEVHPRLNPQTWEQPVAVLTDPARAQALGGVPISSALRVLPGPEGATSWLVAHDSAKGILTALRPGAKVKLESRPIFRAIAENQTQIPLMMNPHHPEVQERALAFIRESMSRYDVDGFLYDDRLRYGNLSADFSELTRRQFEQAVGRTVQWPDDVFRWTYTARLEMGVHPGPLWDAWLTFRARSMKAFVARARKATLESRPDALFGIYSGAWYGEYPRWGVNYASPELQAGFPFLTRAYAQTGFADLLDLLIVGAYYPQATMADAMAANTPIGRTVEAGAVLGNRVARDRTWVYTGVMIADYYSNPKGLERALQAAAGGSQGVMVFDLSHRIEEFWPLFRRAFAQPKAAPHAQPGLLNRLRKARERFDRNHGRESPVPFFEGAAGAGF